MKRFMLGLVALGAAAALWGQDDPSEEELADPNFLKNNRGALILEWNEPACPPAALAEGKVVFARVRFVIEPDGTLSALRTVGGNDERYQESVLAAMKRWKFSATTRKGKPVRTCHEIQFRFDPRNPPPARDPRKAAAPYQLQGAPYQRPVEISCPDPVYPKELELRRLAGTVAAKVAINEAGKVTKVQVERSSHPEFTAAALKTMAAWEFKPASIGGEVPAKGTKESLLSFVTVDPETGYPQRAAWLQRNGIKLNNELDQKPEEYFDQQPTALLMVDPVYPYELATTGTTGEARVTFVVNAQGRVTQVALVEASEPRFGEALAAAISAWVFEPLNRGGDVVPASFSMTWKFAPPEQPGGEYRLLHPEADATPVSMKEIDGKLTPVCLVPPLYPEHLRAEKVAGEASVRAFVDREGRVRWPRVEQSTRPELGWAAVTAASQWFFEPPRKAGQPVDVWVVIPFQFKPDGED